MAVPRLYIKATLCAVHLCAQFALFLSLSLSALFARVSSFCVRLSSLRGRSCSSSSRSLLASPRVSSLAFLASSPSPRLSRCARHVAVPAAPLVFSLVAAGRLLVSRLACSLSSLLVSSLASPVLSPLYSSRLSPRLSLSLSPAAAEHSTTCSRSSPPLASLFCLRSRLVLVSRLVSCHRPPSETMTREIH